MPEVAGDAPPTPPNLDLTDLGQFADGPPHAAYRWLRDHSPVHRHEPTEHTPDGEAYWSLTRYEDVAWAARHPELFSSESGAGRVGGGTLIEDLPVGFPVGTILNMQDEPRHQHVRRLVTPSVSPRRLRSLRADMAERCRVIVDAALRRGSCDFLTEVAAELPLQAIASLLGVPQEDRHFLLEWADATLDSAKDDPGVQSARSQAASAAVFDYSERLLGQKRRCPVDDICSIVATAELPPEAEPGGPIPHLEQQLFFSLLLAGGSETTRNSIAAGALAFIDDPQQWDDLRADPSLMPGAVEEIIRWGSSTVYNRRTATTDIERHGHTINAGDKVVLWWQSANFDERTFTDPFRFDIRRTPNPHLSFGLVSCQVVSLTKSVAVI